MKTKRIAVWAVVLGVCAGGAVLLAHCDTMDGPVVRDARMALELGNANLILKWVQPRDEKELADAFRLALKVRVLGSEARELADRFLFETLVRLHRSGEGVAYSGLKPAGTPIDERVLAADRAIDTGDLKPLEKLVPAPRVPELRGLFARALERKNFAADDVTAGREYVAAYVRFFHYAEGDEDGGHHHE
jgi:hypothetical protein